MSVLNEQRCPFCSARLVVQSTSTDPVVLCAVCGTQFRANGNWPVTRTSRKAIASFILGIISIGGLCFTAVPAVFLGLWALGDIRQPRNAEILSGKRLAITGVSLGGFFSIAIFLLPLLVLIPVRRDMKINELNRSARTHVENERWREAAADCREIIDLEPENELSWLRAAAVYAFADEQAYDRLRDEMLSRFSDSEVPTVADRIAKACLLRPLKQTRLDAVSRMAEKAVKQDSDHEEMLWFFVTRGLAQYRSSNYGLALESCQRCRSGDPSDSLLTRATLCYFIESLAHTRLGANQEALDSLQHGRALLKDNPDLGGAWHDQLIAKLLLAEVEGLINKADAARSGADTSAKSQ